MIDLAIEHFGDWWLVGYGGQDPGWGQLFGSSWTDITNEYICRGVQYGISGVIALLGVFIAGISMLVSLYKSEKRPELKSLYWAMGSVLVMLIISFNACTFFSQTTSLFYCILGIIGSSPNFAVNAMSRSNYS
jgi:O-antigen ligase